LEFGIAGLEVSILDGHIFLPFSVVVFCRFTSSPFFEELKLPPCSLQPFRLQQTDNTNEEERRGEGRSWATTG
jgi:hypothetical protein